MPAKKRAKPKPRTVTFKFNQRYTLALGTFVQVFAIAETQMFLFLVRSTRLKFGLAQALLSGPKIEGQVQILRRLWRVYPPIPEIHKEMEDFLSQLLDIQTVRNSILHNLSFTTSDKGHISSNFVKALQDENVREYPITWKILFEMCSDLTKIVDHMRSLIDSPTALVTERAKQYPGLADAWRYKAPQDHSLRPPPQWLLEHVVR